MKGKKEKYINTNDGIRKTLIVLKETGKENNECYENEIKKINRNSI